MTIHIFGGGTVMHVRNHLALCAPAAGATARALANFLRQRSGQPVELHETRMANPSSTMESNLDVEDALRRALARPDTRAIIFNVALCDFVGQIGAVESGKYAERLQTREVPPEGLSLMLKPAPKLLGLVRQLRPEVASVGFKTTAGETPEVQVARANRMSSEHGVDLVLANDTVTRNNIVLPGRGEGTVEGAIFNGTSRTAALAALAEAFQALIQ